MRTTCSTALFAGLLAVSSAACGGSVGRDGGFDDVADSGLDAGSGLNRPDSGGFDAPDSSIVLPDASTATQADAAVADAGSEVDSGFDAGHSDAGRVDAGSFDGGTIMPEVCDGLDNDGDGQIDRAVDGGALTRPCPLQLGVCNGAKATCLDAGWTQCAYGPTYEVTERACDGLDNDCDGRVDRSWERLLLSHTQGHQPDSSFPPYHHDAGVLVGWDVLSPQLLVMDAGWALSLPADLLGLDLNLTTTFQATFPSPWAKAVMVHDGSSRLFRITQRRTPDASCFRASPVTLGASAATLDADGGELGAREVCVSGEVLTLGAAIAVDGGVRAFATIVAQARSSSVVYSGWFGTDGGTALDLVDAGSPSEWSFFSGISDGGFIRWDLDAVTPIASETLEVGVTRRFPPGACDLADDPNRINCRAFDGLGTRSWYSLEGELILANATSSPLRGSAAHPLALGWRSMDNTIGFEDAKGYTPVARYEVEDGGTVRLQQLLRIDDQLVLVTIARTTPDADSIFGFGSMSLSSFAAEFLCLP